MSTPPEPPDVVVVVTDGMPDKRATAPRRVATAGFAAAVVYVLTVYSIPWLVGAMILVPYELWAVRYGKPGAALSHVVWWAYGVRYTARWWLVGMTGTAFLLWCAWHWLFVWPGLRELWILLGVGLLVGVAGAVVSANF